MVQLKNHLVQLRNRFKEAVFDSVPRRGNDVVHLHGEDIPDPYRHLEDTSPSGTQAWLQAQEKKYRHYIGTPTDETKESIESFYDAPQKGIPVRAGDHYLFYNQGKLMISDAPEDEGRVLVDPKELDPSGLSDFARVHISPDGKHVSYLISQSGNWGGTLYVKDIDTGKDLPDMIKKCGCGIWWDRDGKGFIYNQATDDDTAKTILKHHTLGDSTADTVYRKEEGRGVCAHLTNDRFLGHSLYHGPQEWLFTGANDPKLSLSLKNPVTGEYKKLFDAGMAEFDPVADTGAGILLWTTHNAPKGKVVLFDPENPAPDNWKTIIPENDKDTLRHVFFHHDRLVALYNRNCASQVRMFDVQGKPLGDVPLPEQSAVMFGHSPMPGVGLGADAPAAAGNELFMRVSSFKQPPTVYRYDIRANSLTPLTTPKPEDKDLSDCIVEQLWATSKDGTQIPMTVVRRPDVALDGTAALRMTGYGSRGYGLGPDFDQETADFVRSGGIFVQTNIRGGGEFGEEWHAQGRRLNKQNCFDDFAACAGRLVEKKYTSSPRIVVEGHSAGGLLVLATMLQHRQLFGAVISSCPVADMLGKELFGTKAEHGDPYTDKQDFENEMRYSPLHNIKKGERCPPCLILASGHDHMLLGGDLKFVATMQHDSPQSVTLLRFEKDFGHTTARPREVEIEKAACKKAFIERSIGPIDQNAYKRELSAKQRAAPGPYPNDA